MSAKIDRARFQRRRCIAIDDSAWLAAERRARELDISVSKYIRTLIHADEKTTPLATQGGIAKGAAA